MKRDRALAALAAVLIVTGLILGMFRLWPGPCLMIGGVGLFAWVIGSSVPRGKK